VLGWYALAVRHTPAVVDCHTAAVRPAAAAGAAADREIGQEARVVEGGALGPDGLPVCLGTCVTVLSLLLDRPQGPRAQQVRPANIYIYIYIYI
jgi:hypothetical protein